MKPNPTTLTVHLLAIFLLCFLQAHLTLGHGRLVDPPSRASAWRYGFGTPADYNDHQGFCGGFWYQHENAGGRCGICGDPWGAQDPSHEAPGGKFATGTITGTFKSGTVVPVTVQLTANHMGYFVFRLCPNNNPSRDPDQTCFENHVLPTTKGEIEHYVASGTGFHTVELVLPQGLTCTQCILQWTYTAGNSWGRDPDGTSCVGCGPQETFRACSDIRIVQSDSQFWRFVTPVVTNSISNEVDSRQPQNNNNQGINLFLSTNEVISAKGHKKISIAQKNNKKVRNKKKKKGFTPKKTKMDLARERIKALLMKSSSAVP